MLRRRGAAEDGGGGGHDGAGAMRWLLTYSDLITLLMVFFVVLYSISQVNQGKYITLATSLRNSFTPLTRHSGNSAIQTAPQPAAEPRMLPDEESLRTLARELQRQLQKDGVADKVQLALTTRGLVISFTEEAAFFQAARARLQPRFRTLLGHLAPFLARLPNAIEVDGYTDNLPLHSPKYRDSWQLSSRRATNVVDYLTKVLGLDPHRFGAVAYGQYRPKYPNDTEVDREKNRRVDLVVLRHPPVNPWGQPESAPGPRLAAPLAPGAG